MVRAFRIVFAVVAWLFLAALLVQVFFAGLMLFGEPGGRGLHVDTGWILHTAVILVPVAAALARAGARAIWLSAALTVATVAQPYIAAPSGDARGRGPASGERDLGDRLGADRGPGSAAAESSGGRAPRDLSPVRPC